MYMYIASAYRGQGQVLAIQTLFHEEDLQDAGLESVGAGGDHHALEGGIGGQSGSCAFAIKRKLNSSRSHKNLTNMYVTF